MESTINTAPTPAVTPQPTSQAEFQAIVKLANAGDREALTRLRQTLDDNPAVWEDVSRIAIESERKLIDQIAGGDRLVEESIRRRLQQLRTDLAGPSPPPAIRMGVDRVAVAWLLLHIAEKAFIADSGSGLPGAQFNLKKHDLANRQYIAALKSLQELQERLPKGRQTTDAKPGLRVFGGGEDSDGNQVRPTGTCGSKS